MSLYDLIISRRSIRSYEDKAIPKEVLEKIIEAGRQSPSAANRQPYRFIIVDDSEQKVDLIGICDGFPGIVTANSFGNPRWKIDGFSHSCFCIDENTSVQIW